MVGRKFALVSVTFATLAGSADAGVLFNRSKSKEAPKQPPAKPAAEERVSVLVNVLRSEPDERRRVAAVGELSKTDLRQSPAAGEALIGALQKDPSVAVRAEAAEALGRLRPLTLPAGQALEDALTSDVSPRVRASARTAIGVYLQAGFRATPAQAPAATPARPPVAKKPIPQPQRPTPPARQTSEPPLAAPSPTAAAPAVAPKPLPAARPASRPTPKPAKDDDGPALIGPG